MTEAADTLPPPRQSWWARFKAFLADLRDPFDVEL